MTRRVLPQLQRNVSFGQSVSVQNTLTNVNNGVRSQHGPDDGGLIEQAHRSEVGPAAVVLEIKEDLPASIQRPAHAPEYANKHNESHSVPNQTDHLNCRQYPRPQRVQQDGQQEQPQEDEEDLPAGKDEVWVRDVDTDAHKVSADIHAAGETGDPPQTSHPARRIASLLLPPGGRELGDPVVLAARRGAHAGHLCEGQDDRGVAEDGAEKSPEEAAVAGRRDRGGHGDDDELPGGHVDGHEAESGPEGEVALELLGLA